MGYGGDVAGLEAGDATISSSIWQVFRIVTNQIGS